MQPILKCEKLNKRMGKKQILKDVSLELLEGDILGFIGPNGAGKTTTIKLILGLQTIDSGKVWINQYDVQTEFTKAIEKVGTIVENPDLYLYLSGYENLNLIRRMYQNIPKERIDEVVKLVGLENRIRDKVSKYSLGMRQRLGIAQAILHKPNVLILDEPTNGLDPEGIKELRDLLKQLAQEEKMGILISSHNLAELESFCNKICIIKNGEIIETITIQEAKKVSQSSTRILEIEPIEKATNLLEEKWESIDSQHIRIWIEKDKIPNLIRKLVENNIQIYSLQEEQQTLEEIFLKKTGGNKID